MTLLDDVIVVACRSAGLCAGYSYEGPGKKAWLIREKLNGPFDLDSYRSEKGKEVLFITDPGQEGTFIRLNMTELLPIRSKTLSNQSINQSINQSLSYGRKISL